MNVFEQFEIRSILPRYYLTNLSLVLCANIFFIILLCELTLLKINDRQSKLVIFMEILFLEIKNKVRRNLPFESTFLIALLFTTQMYIVVNNLGGMIPGYFTPTSHLGVNLSLSTLIFALLILFAIYKKGFSFLRVFLPKGIPLGIAPIVFLIEFISFFIKPFALAMRLTASITIGHVIMDLISHFGETPLFPFMIFLGTAFSMLEIFISLLQAYIFTYLSCIYVSNMIESH